MTKMKLREFCNNFPQVFNRSVEGVGCVRSIFKNILWSRLEENFKDSPCILLFEPIKEIKFHSKMSKLYYYSDKRAIRRDFLSKSISLSKPQSRHMAKRLLPKKLPKFKNLWLFLKIFEDYRRKNFFLCNYALKIWRFWVSVGWQGSDQSRQIATKKDFAAEIG